MARLGLAVRLHKQSQKCTTWTWFHLIRLDQMPRDSHIAGHPAVLAPTTMTPCHVVANVMGLNG